MKSKPWIDKVYQDKLESYEVPLDPDHWAQAEAMIIAQERGDKKRRLLLWVLILSSGLGLGLLGWKQSTRSKTEEIKQPLPVIPLRKPQNTPMAIIANQESPCTDLVSNAKLKELISVHNQPVTTLFSEGTRSNQRSTPTGKSSPKLSRILSTYPIKSMTLSPPQAVELSLNNTIELESGTSRVSQNAMAPEEALKHESIDLPMLTHAFYVLNPDSHELILPASDLDREPIKVNRSTWREKGIRMTLAQQSGLNLSDPSISHAALEWYHQQSIGSSVFYGYSLGYKSNFNHSQYSEVITAYQFSGFGSNVQNFGIKPEWMNALYAQGNLGLEVKKHRILLGLRPEFIFGAKGKVDQLHFKETSGIKDIALAQVSPVNEGWLQSGSLNNLVWTISLGYEIRVMNKLGVGIQVDHSLKSPYRPLDTQIRQQATASWNTGFRFSYILN